MEAGIETSTGVLGSEPDVSFDPVVNTAAGLSRHPNGSSICRPAPTGAAATAETRSDGGCPELLAAPEQVAQSLIEVGLAKPVSGRRELVGNHFLTGAGEFAGALLTQQ